MFVLAMYHILASASKKIIINSVFFALKGNLRTYSNEILQSLCVISSVVQFFTASYTTLPFAKCGIGYGGLSSHTESRDWNQFIGHGTTMFYYESTFFRRLHLYSTKYLRQLHQRRSGRIKSLEIFDGAYLQTRYGDIIGTKKDIGKGKTENLKREYGSKSSLTKTSRFVNTRYNYYV